MTFEKRLKEMALFGIRKRRLEIRCNNNPVFKGILNRTVAICSQRPLQIDCHELNEFALQIL